jgi:hypothetical protein
MTKTIKKAAGAAKKAGKAVKRKNRAYAGDRLAQVVAIIATIMALAYVVVRVFNWIRFVG